VLRFRCALHPLLSLLKSSGHLYAGNGPWRSCDVARPVRCMIFSALSLFSPVTLSVLCHSHTLSLSLKSPGPSTPATTNNRLRLLDPVSLSLTLTLLSLSQRALGPICAGSGLATVLARRSACRLSLCLTLSPLSLCPVTLSLSLPLSTQAHLRRQRTCDSRALLRARCGIHMLTVRRRHSRSSSSGGCVWCWCYCWCWCVLIRGYCAGVDGIDTVCCCSC
jgi:hypothetical protein